MVDCGFSWSINILMSNKDITFNENEEGREEGGNIPIHLPDDVNCNNNKIEYKISTPQENKIDIPIYIQTYNIICINTTIIKDNNISFKYITKRDNIT